MRFGYARVSTDEQNLDLQIDSLNKYGVDEIFQEKISSRCKDRKELSKLLDKLSSGDSLVVWRLDRLGRTVKQLLALAEDFESKGITFVSITENFDTSTPAGKFVFHMFCSLAQMERDIVSERTKAGLKSARKRGRVGGRKPIDSNLVDRALRMYFSGDFSVKEIIESTGISKTSLYNYVRESKEERGNDNG